MNSDNEGQEPRDEPGQDAVDKARAGARRLGGWLRGQIESKVDEIKGNQAVQEKLDQLNRHKRDRARAAEHSGLDAIYVQMLGVIDGVTESIRGEVAEMSRAMDVIQHNVGELRLAGTAEDDEEMVRYQGHLTEMRREKEAMLDQIEPLQAERAKLERQRRAAAALYVANEDKLGELKQEAKLQVTACRQRLGHLLADHPEAAELPDDEASAASEGES